MNKLAIRNWAEADRPREKLIQQGRRVLSDAELIAILLGSGSAKESAVDLAQRLLADVSNDLHRLSNLEIEDLSEYNGIGPAKAVKIIAALELGRRRKEKQVEEKPMLNSSLKVFKHIQHKLMDLPHEEFWALYLNTSCRLIGMKVISRGGNDFTPVDIRIIIREALVKRAHSIILAHNHPSGSLQPSEADKFLTEKIRGGAELLNIRVNDHLIITDTEYFSFRDEGLMD
ncbi:MAG TPA: DNA repair protein RadC [Sphingobacterium sp.]|nr:DNA repair protein RadC [Sphingobacterium sp.]